MIALCVLPVLFYIASCNPDMGNSSVATSIDITEADVANATLVDTTAENGMVMNSTAESPLLDNVAPTAGRRGKNGRNNRKRKGRRHKDRKRHKNNRRHPKPNDNRRLSGKHEDHRTIPVKKEDIKVHSKKEPRRLKTGRGRSHLEEKICRTWNATRMKVTSNVTEMSITVDYCPATVRYHPETITCVEFLHDGAAQALCQPVSPPICSHTFRNLGNYTYEVKVQAQCDCFDKAVLGNQQCHDTWFRANDTVNFSYQQTENQPFQEQKVEDNLVVEVLPIAIASVLAIVIAVMIYIYCKRHKTVRPPVLGSSLPMIPLPAPNHPQQTQPIGLPGNESDDDSRESLRTPYVTSMGSYLTINSNTELKPPVSPPLQQVNTIREEPPSPTVEHQIADSAASENKSQLVGEPPVSPPVRTPRDVHVVPLDCSYNGHNASWQSPDVSTLAHYFQDCGSPGVVSRSPQWPQNPHLRGKDNLPNIPLNKGLLGENGTQTNQSTLKQMRNGAHS